MNHSLITIDHLSYNIYIWQKHLGNEILVLHEET